MTMYRLGIFTIFKSFFHYLNRGTDRKKIIIHTIQLGTDIKSGDNPGKYMIFIEHFNDNIQEESGKYK